MILLYQTTLYTLINLLLFFRSTSLSFQIGNTHWPMIYTKEENIEFKNLDSFHNSITEKDCTFIKGN